MLESRLQQPEEKGDVSLNKCLIHRKTSILGRPRKNSKVCECCGMLFQKRELDVLFSAEDTFYLGSGLSTYFLFIKSCIWLSLFCTAVFSLPNIITNLMSGNCRNTDNLVRCVSTRYIDVSVANKLDRAGYLEVQSYLAAATIVGMILGLQYARKKAIELEVQAEALLNESDFAVLFRLRVAQYSEQDIRNGIQDWWERQKNKPHLNQCMGEGFPIEKVVLSYKISEFEALNKQREEIKQFQKKMHKSKNFKNNKTKEEIQEKASRLLEVQRLLQARQLPKNNKCIVVFRFPQQQQYILEQHEKTLLRLAFPCCYNFVSVGGKPVTIKEAALPSQINWHNHEMQTRKKHLWRLFILLVCVLLIAAAEGAIFGLLYLTFKRFKTGVAQIDEYISPVLSIAIGLINTILYRVLTAVSRFEFRATTLEDKASITWKIIVSIFLNSGVLLLFAYFILDLNSVWVANGFIDTMTFSYLLVTFMPHFFSYINIDFIVKLFCRIRVRCGIKKFTQSQANTIYERPTVQLYEKYAWMINLMWWSSIFAPIIPVSYPCALASLFIHYWNEKFHYVALIREPKPFGSYLNTALLKVLEGAPLFLATGNIGLNMALLYIRNQPIELAILFVDLISLGVSVCIFLVPTRVVLRGLEWVFCIKEAEKQGLCYEQACRAFITTYQRENPVYRSDAIQLRRQKQAASYRIQPAFQLIEMQPFVVSHS